MAGSGSSQSRGCSQGPAQGWDSIPGVTPELGTSPEPPRPRAALSQAPGAALFQPFPSRPPLPCHEHWGCTMDAGKAGIPRERPHAAGALCNDNVWQFPYGFGFEFYFLLKPENAVASAEGTGTFPDRVETFPGIPCSHTRTLPLGTSLQGWEVTAPGSSSAAAPLPLPRPTTEQPLQEPSWFPCLSHPLGEDLENNKATSQEFKPN